MKLELRENMYIRTKDGIIAKVDYIDDDTIFFNKELYKTYSDSIDFLEKDNLKRIVKASYNIIDMLEIGDYVNGRKVVDIFYDANDNVMNICVLGSIVYDNNEIKSVITHEQMEQMAYKVEE